MEHPLLGAYIRHLLYLGIVPAIVCLDIPLTTHTHTQYTITIYAYITISLNVNISINNKNGHWKKKKNQNKRQQYICKCLFTFPHFYAPCQSHLVWFPLQKLFFISIYLQIYHANGKKARGARSEKDSRNSHRKEEKKNRFLFNIWIISESSKYFICCLP